MDTKLARLERLHRVGLALGSEKNRDRLVERILIEAKELCRADGGTLYLRTDDDQLRFAIMINDSLGIHVGGTTGKPITLPPIAMFDPATKAPNHQNVASYCAVLKGSVNIPNAYDAKGFDFSGTKKFDERNTYRSTSFLTIPMKNQEDRVIGVLQLINAKNEAGEVIPFHADLQEVAEALASQAAVALDNQMLLSGQRALMESFIKLIAAAIDDKSPYTGGHCRRVPILTEMIAREVCRAKEGPFASFNLTDEEWYELHIAAWLHDCGKVTTPVHVMDKATKLETISDRIGEVRARFACLAAEARARHAERIAGGANEAESRSTLDSELAALGDDVRFLEVANIGGEFMSEDKRARVREIGERTFRDHEGKATPLLTEEEILNLTISRGTLTDRERIVINGHMVQTIRMLEALPFPRNLARVPEYAAGHHEKMDGSGYPRGVYAGDMSVPARIMAIADVFEALTAQDRPYKKGKPLSEAMKIMGFMKKDNHLDPALFDLFVKSGVYRRYAEMFVPKEQLDAVDEASLLAITAKPFQLPPEEDRAKRKQAFLPEYAATIRENDPITSIERTES
jgi:HD-GYP domain-containing protein (c-di-GMP phosphodiesterase class II)